MSLFDDFNPLKFIPPNLIGTVFTILQWVVIATALMLAYYFFVHKPRQYKDEVEIWDATGAGVRVLHDKGRWKVNNKDGTGTYVLLKHKTARLKAPNQEQALINKKGKLFYRFLKLGDGPHDFAQLSQEVDNIDEEAKEKIDIIPLSDLDWAKQNVKREMEKKTLGGWFSENKGLIIGGASIGVGLLVILWIIGFGTDVMNVVAGTVNSNAVEQRAIAEAFERAADVCSGKIPSTSEGVPPPF